MSRETEVAAYLAADPDLFALAAGGIYPASILDVSGITEPKSAKDVWANDVFNPTIVVRQGIRVSTGQLVDLKTQETDTNQRVAVWLYALDLETLEAMHNAVYGLMQGHKFSGAWGAEYIETIDTTPVPELPPGTWGEHIDFRIRAILRPILA